jgi:predicted  nucleic acid-binding Zn-ribbon protein
MQIQELTTKFLKSNHTDFDSFYREEIMSTGFSPEVKPETALEINKIDDEEENSEKYESKLKEANVSFNTKDSSIEALQEVIKHLSNLYSQGVDDIKFINSIGFALSNSIAPLAHEQNKNAMKIFNKIFKNIKSRL